MTTLAWWWRGRPERHLDEAERLLEAGLPNAARPWLELPASAPRTRPRALLLRARSAVDRGHPEQAVEALEGIDPDGPMAAEAAFWKGRVLYDVGQLVRALAWFQEALRRRPEDVEALRWLAADAYDLGDRRTAIGALKSLVRLVPDDDRAWRTLAVVYKEKLEQYDEARLAYEQAIRHGNGSAAVRLELAEVLVAMDLHDDAEAILVALHANVDPAERDALLAECLIEQGRLDEAQSVLDEALGRVPDHPKLLAEAAELDHRLGRFEQALSRLDHALAADPARVETLAAESVRVEWLHRRGLVLARLGRLDESREAMAAADRLRSDLDELAVLDDQAASHPRDPRVRVRLASVCRRLGMTAMAASWYRAALACDPTIDQARTGLAELEGR